MMNADITDDPGYTPKQMSDACEMLVAAELTLAGIPALKVPDNWPGYDLIAQPPGTSEPQRISVKSRTFKQGPAYIGYSVTDPFEWLALVILPGDSETRRRIFVIPREVADEKARRNKPTTKSANGRYWSIAEVETIFAAFESNFSLRRSEEQLFTVKTFGAWPPAEQSAFIASLAEKEHYELTREHPEDAQVYTAFFEKFLAVHDDHGTASSEGMDRINVRVTELSNLAKQGKCDLSSLPIRDVVLDVVDDEINAYLARTRHDRKPL